MINGLISGDMTFPIYVSGRLMNRGYNWVKNFSDINGKIFENNDKKVIVDWYRKNKDSWPELWE